MTSDTPKTQHAVIFPEQWKADDVEQVLIGILEEGLAGFKKGDEAEVITLTEQHIGEFRASGKPRRVGTYLATEVEWEDKN